MAGQSTATTKPSRSDEVPDPDQQMEISNRVRSQFESLAPKRPAKPNRSETDPTASFCASDNSIDIPELDRLRSLRSQPHGKFMGEGDCSEVKDEFVETEYYKNLAAIDKQHHTTGSGFIKVDKEGGGEIKTSGGAEIAGDGDAFSGRHAAVLKGNPATNDWIPAMEEDPQVFMSSKPSRSESS
ncbi:PREDICTED: uncharacterized protein LOC104819864 [Tarenaya hassleriana]|uniref:uncharacterized protein LOC104819864 n=1 Tax=Tarenaya hassleriana TaxID=28532 RepID=UPI00053C9977|nr:PREDICTED: uncharacterized protein LOC104819864 [Tarenaya hassleriana]